MRGLVAIRRHYTKLHDRCCCSASGIAFVAQRLVHLSHVLYAVSPTATTADLQLPSKPSELTCIQYLSKKPTASSSGPALLPASAWRFISKVCEVACQDALSGESSSGDDSTTIALSNNPMWMREYAREISLAEGLSPLLKQLRDVEKILHESTEKEKDKAMESLAREEIDELCSRIRSEFEDELLQLVRRRIAKFLPSDSNLWTLELFGRAGGEEASIFAADLAAMYTVYCSAFGWSVRNITDRGSASTAANPKLRLEGQNIFTRMRHEIGVHRVQRVPVTEASGRMQTSTASVVLMPIPDAVQVNLREEDCDITMVRGSGPGGQGVNSSSNCAVVKHLPTGIVVRCHCDRSGNTNRAMALETIAQKLWESKYREQKHQMDMVFSSQWNSGERAEKIRTYNAAQNRVTDHRCRSCSGDFLYTSFMTGAPHGGLGLIHDTLMAEQEAELIDREMTRLVEEGLPM